MTDHPTPERLQESRKVLQDDHQAGRSRCRSCGQGWPCDIAIVLAALEGAEATGATWMNRCHTSDVAGTLVSERLAEAERQLEEARRGLDSALCLLVEGVEFMKVAELREQVRRVFSEALKASE